MRLSLAARALAYGEKSLAYKNPKFVSAMKVDQTSIHLIFDVDVELVRSIYHQIVGFHWDIGRLFVWTSEELS